MQQIKRAAPIIGQTVARARDAIAAAEARRGQESRS
jgi:hypothetical protein